jgi:copper(I)-binding protein
VNNSPDVNDKLVSITSDVGKVTLTGDTSVPANGVLAVGEPDGQIAPLESAERADAAEAAVALSKPITNGLTYNFTFDFEKAGETTMTVPISAGEAPRREAAVEAGDTSGHH